jgi:site-specific recombinase XerD
MDLVELVKKEMLRRKYSIRTISTYVFYIKKFLLWVWRNEKKDNPRRITKYDVKRYLDWLCLRKRSASTLNVNLQALKFAIEQILGKRFFVRLPYSKRATRLPVVLSQDEVKRLLSVIVNRKHKLIASLIYGAGLRVTEAVSLKPGDLDFSKKIGWVRKGKGNKERIFIIPDKISGELQSGRWSDGFWVFKGRNGHITARTVQEIIKNASQQAEIRPKPSPHSLRHSFATHLIENGYDLLSVQALLGHSNIRSTMVYVHLIKPKMVRVVSPLDQS